MKSIKSSSNQPENVYNTFLCSGCEIEIKDEYTEIAMTSVDGIEVKHIALCSKCNDVAKKYGVI